MFVNTPAGWDVNFINTSPCSARVAVVVRGSLGPFAGCWRLGFFGLSGGDCRGPLGWGGGWPRLFSGEFCLLVVVDVI